MWRTLIFSLKPAILPTARNALLKKSIRSASISWDQFKAGYIDGMQIEDRNRNKSPLYILPGNHDVTNAIGFYNPMVPATDAASMAGEFNNWNPEADPMQCDEFGTWTKTKRLPLGKIEYKFIVDGQWAKDPENSMACLNCFGTQTTLSRSSGLNVRKSEDGK